jgi:hypothetical protein
MWVWRSWRRKTAGLSLGAQLVLRRATLMPGTLARARARSPSALDPCLVQLATARWTCA